MQDQDGQNNNILSRCNDWMIIHFSLLICGCEETVLIFAFMQKVLDYGTRLRQIVPLNNVIRGIEVLY